MFVKSLLFHRQLCFIFCISAWGTLLLVNNVSRQTSNYLKLERQVTLPQIELRKIATSCDIRGLPLHNLPRVKPKSHPRMICLSNNMQRDSCFDTTASAADNSIECFQTDSIPSKSTNYDSEIKGEYRSAQTSHSEEECTIADSRYENLSGLTPSTCNEVHSMGLTYTSLDRSIGSLTPKDESIKFLSQGGYNSVWRHESLHDRVIMKMHRPSRKFSDIDLDRNRRDALISGLSGRSPNEYNNNVLPIYQYCGFTLVVPLASQPLDEYVYTYRENHNGQLMGAVEIFHLAFQAARGLYQSHLYLDGKATTAHSDVKPSQFLLFEPPQDYRETKLPLLQLNDFNRCRLLYRSESNETCPFHICAVKHKGSTYRSPEEYMDCANQKDSIDIFSLGGVFYYLLSDGLDPYDGLDFDLAVKRILSGKLPRLPPLDHYKELGEEAVEFVKKRTKHPASQALRQILSQCWNFEPEERPSSLEVVKMFEEASKSVT